MKKILSICIAAYNRKDTLIPDVNNYLSLDDDRFIITVQDDGSTDGTYEELEKINNPKLKLRKNSVNLGGLQNAKEAMDNNEETLYVLKLDDKDFIDIAVLPLFLDYLEEKRPYYGHVDLSNNKPMHIETIAKGIDAINKLGYLCRHPSGFFWRYNIYHEEIHKDYYKKLPPKFDYQFDLMYAHCAVYYPGDIVYMPLITYAVRRPELAGNKSYSYSEDNLFYGTNKRLETFNLFLNDIAILDIEDRYKYEAVCSTTKKMAYFVTTIERFYFQHKDICYHYNLTPRTISFKEMEFNLYAVLNLYRVHAYKYASSLKVSLRWFRFVCFFTLNNLKTCIKESIWKFESKPFC